MRNHSRSYLLGGLLLAAGVTGTVMMFAPLMGPGTRNISAKDRAMALEVWNGAIVSPAQAKGREVLPAAGLVPATPLTIPRPAQAPAHAAAPCPARVQITNDRPNSSTNYHCSSTNTTVTGGVTNLSVSSSNYQNSGATNRSSSSTVITITND